MAPPRSNKAVYYHLYAAQALALVSTGVATVALALLAYRLAGADAGAVLGTAMALKMAAYVTVAPVAAAFAERLPRRPLLIALDLVRAAVALVMPFVTTVGQIYALILVYQAASAIFTPVYQAIVPDLLADERAYTQALARSRLAYEMEGVVSPAIAAGLLMVTGVAGLFTATTAGFLLSAALILRVRLPEARVAGASDVLQRIGIGARAFIATPRLRGLALVNLAAAAATAMVTVNTVVLAQGELGLSERATAIALSVFGAGSVLATVLLLWLLARFSDRGAMLGGAAACAAMLAVGATMPGHGALLLLWAGLGAATALAQVPAGAVLRRTAAREERLSLYAAQFALANLALMLCYPLAGWGGSELGLPAAFLLLGGIAAAAALGAARLWPAGDGYRVPAEPDDSPATEKL